MFSIILNTFTLTDFGKIFILFIYFPHRLGGKEVSVVCFVFTFKNIQYFTGYVTPGNIA